MSRTARWTSAVLIAALAATGALLLRDQGDSRSAAQRPRPAAAGAVAVAVAPVETGSIVDRREFTGTLQAAEEFTVAPKIGGRIERVHVDIGDRVRRGEVLVELDDAEYRQVVAEAEAALAVARAELRRARTDADLALRELQRVERLARRDLASDVELDTARARAESQRAAVAVAEARVDEREAVLASQRVRLSYTEVRADWTSGADTRVVGERMVSAGDTVAANVPLLSVLGIDRLTAVVYAPERDYALLDRGQAVALTAAALPGRSFQGEIVRIAPRFEEQSRQARFEVAVDNADNALKPGMFVTVEVTVDQAE
ncbi:MAG: efflux RND transporter periplasmic adaptor subunit, partial [Candidatus Competibacterales bacterium]|nr:efflux RND transporter periplasmic adaptor subunit [Candidatus Competibacterales bacterium]